MKDDSTAAAVCPARADHSARARGRFDASRSRCTVGLLVEQPREDLGAVADEASGPQRRRGVGGQLGRLEHGQTGVAGAQLVARDRETRAAAVGRT
jgi:hypothetical protein